MTQPSSLSQRIRPTGGRVAIDPANSQPLAEPILAGMRARRVADNCEDLRLAAVLIDTRGRVLHLTSGARSLVGTFVEVTADHLVGPTPRQNAVLERAITAALSGTARKDQGRDPADEDDRVHGLTYRDASPYQFLRGLVILNEPSDSVELQALKALLSENPDLTSSRI